MRIICTSPSEEKQAEEFRATATAAGFQTDIVRCRDSYALTMWGVDDVEVIDDKRVETMSIADKEAFMEFAQKQLKEDMIERGWDSLSILIDEFYSRKATA